MSWQQRGRSRAYYHSERIGSRVVRRYCGIGAIAELAAAADDLRRLERTIEVRERRAEQERLAAAEAPLLLLCEVTDNLARATLLAAGYHRHDRSAWRLRRESKQTPTGD
jgi:hypothetical protein